MKLPEGPASTPAFAASGEVTSAEVARLAAALGIAGEPRLAGDVWLAGRPPTAPVPGSR